MTTSFYGLIVLALVLAFLSFLGTALYRAVAIRIKLIDYPNERSSHSIPTPSGAGLVFAGLTIGCIYLVISPTNGDWAKLSLLLSFTAVALLGTLDDGFNLPILLRIVLQVLFVFGIMAAVNDMSEPTAFWSMSLGTKVLISVLILIGMLWFLNLYNFMDGIDGFAASEAIFIATVSGAFLYAAGDIELSFWMLILVASLCGFLYWNVSPAKIFMGDAGSSFLGFFFGTVAFLSVSQNKLTLSFWLIVCALFITDATVTIITRLSKGENIFKAHRTHAYQHATERLGGHGNVVKLSMLINILWLTPLAALSFLYEHYDYLFLVLSYVPLVLLCVYLRAGRPQPVSTHTA